MHAHARANDFGTAHSNVLAGRVLLTFGLLMAYLLEVEWQRVRPVVTGLTIAVSRGPREDVEAVSQ